MKHIKVLEQFLNEGDRSDVNDKINDLEDKFKSFRQKQKEIIQYFS